MAFTTPRFPPPRTFHSLSFRDVLDARDAYHVHLTSLDHVVGTAIALHRFRRSELVDGAAPRAPHRAIADRSPRTFDNSVVTRRSWPVLLVIVSNWATHMLVRLWESAWHEGGAPGPNGLDLRLMTENELQSLYRSKRFLPAFAIDAIAGHLSH